MQLNKLAKLPRRGKVWISFKRGEVVRAMDTGPLWRCLPHIRRYIYRDKRSRCRRVILLWPSHNMVWDRP